MSPETPLDRDAIARRIPHQGRMCLLDRVLRWSATSIDCEARPDPGTTHPLRRAGDLSAVHAVEYAAQAMAVHGTLLAGRDDAPRAGYLASVRGVQLHRDTLEPADAPLHIHAERLSGDGGSVLYRFQVDGARGAVAEGRAAVVLDAAAVTGGSA